MCISFHIKPQSQRHAGFTVLELVLVILLLGVTSAFVLPRFFATSSFEARFYFDEWLAALSAAQQFAKTSGCDVQFQFYDATPPIGKTAGYSLWRAADCDASTPVYSSAMIDPISQAAWQNSQLDSRSYQLNSVDIESLVISFNEQLQVSVQLNGAPVSGELTLIITDNAVGKTMKLDTNTGFIWQP